MNHTTLTTSLKLRITRKLLPSLVLINSFSLFCSDQEILRQQNVMKLGSITSLQDVAQYESQCYPHDYTAFNANDLPQTTNSSSDAENSTVIAPVKKSLYAQFNRLPIELQDHITGYLKKTIQDPTTTKFAIIDDITWKTEHEQQFKRALRSWLPKSLPLVKDCLRTEYWLRYVARARNLYPMTNNHRMVPSELCLTGSSYQTILDNPCTKFFPEHDIEIAALMIYCGALVNLNKTAYRTPLFCAIDKDYMPMVKLLIKAGLTQTQGSKTYSKATALHIAAESNALNVIRYLHSIGYDLNVQEGNGHTPLHRAHFFKGRNNLSFCRFSKQAMQLLLDLGANPNIQNNRGQLYNDPNNTFYACCQQYDLNKLTSLGRTDLGRPDFYDDYTNEDRW